MNNLIRFIMNEWAKVIFTALIGGLVVFAGNYTALMVESSKVETRLTNLESTVEKQGTYIPTIIENKNKLVHLENLVTSLGPSISELNSNVNSLNTTIAGTKGEISTNTKRLEDVKRSQDKMSDDILEIYKILK